MGGILHGRLANVYFGAHDPKAGACGSVLNLSEIGQLNAHCQVHGGLLADECAKPLAAFFERRRQENRTRARPLRQDALRLPAAHLDGWMPGCTPLSWHHLRSAEGLLVRGWSNASANENARTLLLCLHGVFSWSYLYRELLVSASPQHTVVWSIDLPGHGASDKTKSGHELMPHFQLNVVKEILANHPFDEVHVLAHAQGCVLAAELARFGDARVRTLTLCNPQASVDCDSLSLSSVSLRSNKQLHSWIQDISGGRADFADAMCAPYVDAGHLKGLLRHLDRGHTYRPLTEALFAVPATTQIHVSATYHTEALCEHPGAKLHQTNDFFLGLPANHSQVLNLNTLNEYE